MQENAQNTPAQSDTPQSVSANAPQNKCDTAQPAQASTPDRSCGAEVVNGAQAARQSTSLWRAAFRATVPVLCGYLALGSAFGLLLNAAGYGALAAGAMSVVLYAGSGQFLAAQMLASGATLVEMALATFFLNARHMVYGLSLLDEYAHAGKYRFQLMFELTDEAYALLTAGNVPPGADRAKYNSHVQLLCHAYWILGSVIGAAIGMLLPINTKGLDFSLTALFITILLDQLRLKNNRLPAIIGAACALVMRGLLPDNMLLGGMLLMLAVLIASRRGIERYQEGAVR